MISLGFIPPILMSYSRTKLFKAAELCPADGFLKAWPYPSLDRPTAF
jgi:hypothetical protein